MHIPLDLNNSVSESMTSQIDYLKDDIYMYKFGSAFFRDESDRKAFQHVLET